MKISVTVLGDKPYPDGKLAEMHEIEISDDQLLKLGKKYFELASNPVTSTYVNVQPDLGDDATISQCSEKKDYIATIDHKGTPRRYDREDLIDMAKAIKTFCSDCEECEGCPFWSEKDHCGVYDTPDTWKV